MLPLPVQISTEPNVLYLLLLGVLLALNPSLADVVAQRWKLIPLLMRTLRMERYLPLAVPSIDLHLVANHEGLYRQAIHKNGHRLALRSIYRAR